MTERQNSIRKHFIELLQNNGFNCFPIPHNKKVADSRYKASKTTHNQPILETENYGYIPILGMGTAIIDLDDKERYRKFAESMIKECYMVIETGQGWHVPVIGLTGSPSKIELFDYEYQPDKKIIEIQGPDHYCIGPGSEIFHDKLERQVFYENRGTETIWDARGKDFHEFVDGICKNCDVTSKKKDRSGYHSMRERFLVDKLPTEGTSNHYFFQAAIQCNTDGMTIAEATEKIKQVYDKWTVDNTFSDRPWSNIESKITEVYEKDMKLKEGRPRKNNSDLDCTAIAQEFVAQRKIYSDEETHEIFEDKNGFLEKINNSLLRELMQKYPVMERKDYSSILFKLEGLAGLIPESNKHLFVFTNGKFDKRVCKMTESEELADMGFPDYQYLEPTDENKPVRFLEIMFGNIPQKEHPRIKAGLRAILTNYLDPRISVIHGLSGVGKSTGLSILVLVLKDYAMAVELDQLLDDSFIRAHIDGLRLLVLQELPQDWKRFSKIKVMTGETKKTECGFHQDSSMFDNKLKIWASGNYLTKIPQNEKNAMYERRLSLIHNTRTESYPENTSLAEEIAKEEGEKIVSWILNLTDEECKYEDPVTVRDEWEKLASPEIEYLEENYTVSSDTVEVSVISILREFKQKTGVVMEIDQMTESLKKLGYVIKYNIIKNIEKLPEKQVSGSLF